MCCILVVDDDPDLREAVALTLRRAGHAARQAADGSEALALAQEHVPSMVLLDLEMPMLDGRGFLEARRGLPALAGVPVVLMSGATVEAAALAAAFPGVGFLPKPFRAAELRAAVARFAPPQADDKAPG